MAKESIEGQETAEEGITKNSWGKTAERIGGKDKAVENWSEKEFQGAGEIPREEAKPSKEGNNFCSAGFYRANRANSKHRKEVTQGKEDYQREGGCTKTLKEKGMGSVLKKQLLRSQYRPDAVGARKKPHTYRWEILTNRRGPLMPEPKRL